MSPRPSKEFEAMRKKSKTNIMETALELFAKNGFYNTSISSIAKTAGVSKGLMYNYFDSKEALLEAIIFQAADESQAVLNTNLVESVPPFEQLEQMVDQLFLMIKNNLSHWKLLTSLSFQTEAISNFKDKLEARREESIQQFIHLFEQMGVENPMKEAFLVGSILDGMMMHYMFMGDEYPLQEMKDYFLNRLYEKN